MAEHTLSAEPTHSRWDRDLPPRLSIEPGDTVRLACVDASGAQVHPGMTVAAIDRLVHHSTIFELNVESYRRRQERDADWTNSTGWGSPYLDLDFLNMRSIFSFIASMACWLFFAVAFALSAVLCACWAVAAAEREELAAASA